MLGTVEFREGKKVEVSWRHTAIDPLHNTSGDGKSCFRVFDRSSAQELELQDVGTARCTSGNSHELADFEASFGSIGGWSISAS